MKQKKPKNKNELRLKFPNVAVKRSQTRGYGSKEEDWFVEDKKGQWNVFHLDKRNFLEKNWLSIISLIIGIIAIIISVISLIKE